MDGRLKPSIDHRHELGDWNGNKKGGIYRKTEAAAC